MLKRVSSLLKILFGAAFLSLNFSTIDAQIRVLNFDSPYRMKDMLALRTTDGSEEFWHVGGQGNLVINTGKNRIDKTIADADLNSIFLANERTFFVVGNRGTLLVSKNRGEDWEKIKLDTAADLESIFCLNENKCWIVGAKDGLLISGGITDGWTSEKIMADGEFKDVCFVNERTGFIVGDDNLLLQTDDGGDSWWRVNPVYKTRVSQLTDGEYRFEAVGFLNQRTGCAVGWDIRKGIVVCTHDGGKTWSSTLLEETFFAIVWKSEKEAYLLNEYGDNFISKDGGRSWAKFAAEK